MSIKKIVSSVVSATLLATSFTLPSYAEESFSTVQEFLTDVISLSTLEVESQSLDAAIEAAINKVTTVDDEVFYDGTSIGYWYSDSSSTLWTSESKEATAIDTDTNGYTANPSILYDILYDVNDKLEDNYVPTTTDWSKIIGKYDVKLGNMTIPADHWIKSSVPCYDETVNGAGVTNITSKIGYKGTDLGSMYSNSLPSLRISPYLITTDGTLYLSNIVGCVGTNGTDYEVAYEFLNGSTAAASLSLAIPLQASETPCIKLNMTEFSTGVIKPTLYFTDSTNTKYQCANSSYFNSGANLYLYKYDNPSVKYTGAVNNANQVGYFWFTDTDGVITDAESNHQEHIRMFESCSTSKLVKGNQKLTRRLSVIATLLPTDTVTVTATNWTINGHDNSIDNYITDQELNNAGDTANIAAVADIDALKFHVVVPTSLPIYVDDSNITYVANNADIINKSGAAVKLTGVNIVANAESGWIMVDGSPTKEMEGHEFNFSTTIEQNKVLDVSEVYPFQYMANLSPTTEASSSLELATVMVTVDWAQTNTEEGT